MRARIGTPRSEDRYSIGLAVSGDLGSNCYARLGYRYTTRDSNAAGRSYDRNQLMLTVGWLR